MGSVTLHSPSYSSVG
jgi:hypothetical protein